MEKRKINKKTIIIIVIIVVIVIGICVFFLLPNSKFSFMNIPDFSSGSKIYDLLGKLSGGNSFKNVQLNPFNETG